MSQVKSQHTDVMVEPDAEPSIGGVLSAVSAKFIMVATVLFCGAALWNVTSFGAGEAAWFVAFILVMIIRAPHSKRNATNAIVKSFSDTRSLVVFPLLLTVMVLPLTYLAGWLPPVLDYSLPHWVTYFGIALQVPYLWLFYRSHADLTRNWSPGLEIRYGHELVTGGVYRRIRHPMYAAIAISAVAQPLLLQNWISGPPALLMTLLFLSVRVPAEERMMARHFGDDYKRYRLQTGHFLPRLPKTWLS
jgi:protein-S-isoprenylcysteine O-methyltransferase Ste14